MSHFAGFPPETAAFLRGIAENNNKAWFTENRALYDKGYVEAGRAFVEAIGPELRTISPTVQFEAKIGGSLMRVNRDIRFSRDKRAYKEHLDIWFAHGEQRGWTHPGFFMRIAPEVVWLGSGMHHFADTVLVRFRDAVVDDRSGEALAATIASVEAAGPYVVGMASRKQVPRGFDKTLPRANLLLFESLNAMCRLPIEDVLAADFSAQAMVHFRATWPIAKWLLDEVVE